ncbi:hypothetical protein [Pseudotabrizicola sp.]|uniref:hypothetical protein n=1 Tax=Pseudotabrizicola sp. TaxID=2939647 RepID=UPI00272731A2|nr:hypothetical protein [Pseudotabrizicola sp.]MDO8883517.1 hypothetical protein [Pseudotabrizicola sp.]
MARFTLLRGTGRKTIAALGLVSVLAVGALVYLRAPALAQMAGHMHGGMHGHGMGGSGHDEANMPGLRGENASPEESAELAVMFRNFNTFTREVTNLPNGIRSVTRSSDPEVMAALVSHVAGMISRVQSGDDPKIFIQSPTLDIFFERGEGITSDITVTDEGIVVVRTSTDPEVVAALQLHAAEVSDMAARGMQAVHEMMMQGGH